MQDQHADLSQGQVARAGALYPPAAKPASRHNPLDRLQSSASLAAPGNVGRKPSLEALLGSCGGVPPGPAVERKSSLEALLLAASVAAAAQGEPAVQRKPSLQTLLRSGSSLAAAGLGALDLGMGSQDLAGLLDTCSPRSGCPRGAELDFLASPKWKALLQWESASAAASPRHLEGGSSSGTSGTSGASGTASIFHVSSAGTALHAALLRPAPESFDGGSGSEGAALVSPGVDQQLSGEALEAAWREAAAAQVQAAQLVLQVLQPLAPARQLAEDAEMTPADAAAALAGHGALPHAPKPRRASGLGKKRPSWIAAEHRQQPDTPTGASPPAKQLRQGWAGGAAKGSPGGRPFHTSRFDATSALGPADVAMLDAESAEADAAASAAAFDAAAAAALLGGPLAESASPGEDPEAADVLTGLIRFRLNSMGSTVDQRRLTAAAAAAAVAPAGRLGIRLHRGGSEVAMLVPPGLLPTSPTFLAAASPTQRLYKGEPEEQAPFGLLLSHGAPGQAFGKVAGGMPEPADTVVRVQVKVETSGHPPHMLLPFPEAAQQLPPGFHLPDMPQPPDAAQAPVLPVPEAGLGLHPVPAMAAAAGHAPKLKRQVLATKSHKAVATGETGLFTSGYRGVTRHRLTGRYEAHFWDSSYVRPDAKKGKRTKGRQVYVGGYETELEAARAYDRAVIAYLGTGAPLNFPVEDYCEDLVWMAGRTPEEVVSILRKGSVGFARGQSQYRGVTRHHQQGRWEARIGRVEGAKYMYLGTYDTAEEAARAYDRACVKYRGAKAILNFDLSEYQEILDDPESYDPTPASLAGGAFCGTISPGGGGYCSTFSPGAGGTAALAHVAGRRDPAASAADALGYVPPAAAMYGGGMQAGLPAGMLVPLPCGSSMFWPLPMMADAQQAQQAQQAWAAALPFHLSSHQGHSTYQPSPLGPAYSYQLAPAEAAASDAATAQAYAADLPAAGPAQAAHGDAGPRLPAIRTRAAAVAAATVGAGAVIGGSSGSTPRSAGLADVDLAGFLLSPLGASLLSPLSMAGTPGGWRDSPLSRFFAEASAGHSSAGLFSPGRGGQHRRVDTGISIASTASAFGAGAGPTPTADTAAGLHGVACLLTSSGAEAEMSAALQWLETLDPAQLAALLDSPTLGGSGSGASNVHTEQQPAGDPRERHEGAC